MDTGPFDLERFVEAQDRVFARAWSELSAGRKDTHWMWFIFPQLSGLGQSEMSNRYGIRSLEEARAYMQHPILGDRLRECTKLVVALPEGTRVNAVFGTPDDLKFHSSMTLFACACGDCSPFHDALAKFFDGEDDPGTVKLLRATKA
ncbi:MAG: DUF1810 domain-containing protein [Alphaproteobacteria bacterium]|nr:DUF1810 domain-containing protein [Alphaproteobacteria bacterium]MBL7097588.1 DUF1810 domain-containing protein [Alphaproteobacteria bacterium]